MKKNIKIFLILVAFFVPAFASADTLLIQADDTATSSISQTSSGHGGGVYQTLGNGYDYVVDGYTFKIYNNDELDTEDWYSEFISCASLTDCTSNTHVVLHQELHDTPTLLDGTSALIQVDLDTPILLSTSTFYALHIWADSSGPLPDPKPSLHGTTTNAYPAGVCDDDDNPVNGFASSPLINDCLFIIFGSGPQGSGTQTYNHSPADGATTPDDLVTLSFDYYARPADSVDSWEIALVDLTDASTTVAIYDGLLTDFPSGTISLDRYLIENHTYSYRTLLFDSSDSSQHGILSTYFSVIDGSNQYNDIYGDFGNDLIDDLPDFDDCDSVGFPENIGCYLGVAIQRGLLILFSPSDTSKVQFATLDDQLAEKLPFAYIYDLKDIYDLATGISATTTPKGIVDFDSLSLSTSSEQYGIYPDIVEFFSTTTITRFLPASLLSLIRLFIVALLWLGFATMVFFKIKNELK